MTGRLVLAGIAASALFGLNTNANLAYQIFCFLVAVMGLSICIGLLVRPRFNASRRLPRFGSVGTPFSYPVRIMNRTGKTLRGLFVMERPSDPRPSFPEFMSAREPRQQQRNRFDRTVGYHRWLWLLHMKRTARIPENPVPDLAPGSRGEVHMEVTPLRRGRLELTGLTIAVPDPLGLFRSMVFSPLAGTVMILPRLYPVNPIDLPGHRKHQPGGVALASSVGDAEEFVSLREYRPGDPLRRIHWKSWAKAGKPIVKETQEEFFVRFALILDTFHPVPGDEIFEEAVSVAASFVSTMSGRESLLDLMFVGPEAYCFTSGRGLSHMDRMLEILASVHVCQDRPFTDLFPLVMQRAGLLSACLCVFLSWDEERQRLVSRLREQGLPVEVFLIMPAQSQETPSPGPLADRPDRFHALQCGRIEEDLLMP
jgi:uncharacterized protein (DUF58 family)